MIEFAACVSDVAAGLETAEDAPVVRSAARILVAGHDPDVHAARIGEARRHDADDATVTGIAVQSHRVPVLSFAERLAPEPVADDGGAHRSAAPFARHEAAANLRPNAEDVEEPGADRRGVDTNRSARPGMVRRPSLKAATGRNGFDRPSTSRQAAPHNLNVRTFARRSEIRT